MAAPKRKQPPTMSDVLRQAILESKIPLLVLSKGTGVQRASISRFLNESQSLRLDCADKLAAHFGLVLVKDEAE
jgi:plasmid maintenance system antidote protein VapI